MKMSSEATGRRIRDIEDEVNNEEKEELVGVTLNNIECIEDFGITLR